MPPVMVVMRVDSMHSINKSKQTKLPTKLSRSPSLTQFR